MINSWKTMQRVGIFGGTFDPVHNTHLKMALEFTKQMELDLCLFVPAYISPFKTEENKKDNSQHRINMLELAIAGNSKFIVEKYEIDKKGISYTIDTFKYLKEKYLEAELYFLIGSDQIKDFRKWKDWEDILSLVRLCIVNRCDYHYEIDFLKKKGNVFIINFQETDVSSSKIRELIKNALSLKGLLPEAVEQYIKENRLYLDD